LLASAAAATSPALILAGALLGHRDHQKKRQMSILRDRLVAAVDLGRLAHRDAPSSLDRHRNFYVVAPSELLLQRLGHSLLHRLLAYDKHMRTPSLLGVYLRLPEWLIAAAGLLNLGGSMRGRGRREHANSVIWLLLSLALALTLLSFHSCPALQPYLLRRQSALCSLLRRIFRQCMLGRIMAPSLVWLVYCPGCLSSSYDGVAFPGRSDGSEAVVLFRSTPAWHLSPPSVSWPAAQGGPVAIDFLNVRRYALLHSGRNYSKSPKGRHCGMKVCFGSCELVRCRNAWITHRVFGAWEHGRRARRDQDSDG